jgi:hypothetical protein
MHFSGHDTDADDKAWSGILYFHRRSHIRCWRRIYTIIPCPAIDTSKVGHHWRRYQKTDLPYRLASHHYRPKELASRNISTAAMASNDWHTPCDCTRHHCRILGPSPWCCALPYMISIHDRWHHTPPGDPPSRPRPWRHRPTIHRAGLCLSASSSVGRWRKGTSGVATARVSLLPPQSRRGTISFLSKLQRNEVCYFSYLLIWHHRYWFIVVSSQFTAWPNLCSALKCVTYFGKM